MSKRENLVDELSFNVGRNTVDNRLVVGGVVGSRRLQRGQLQGGGLGESEGDKKCGGGERKAGADDKRGGGGWRVNGGIEVRSWRLPLEKDLLALRALIVHLGFEK